MNVCACLPCVLVILLVLLEGSRCGKKGLLDSKSKRTRGGKCKPTTLAEYELSFHGAWSKLNYPKMYPVYRPPAQWSKLVGRTHSDQYTMWTLGTFATAATQSFAEGADTKGFDDEAQSYGGIRDTFTAAPIRGGMGKTETNIITDGRHTKISFMVRMIPSPDWFVGVSDLDLCERKRWRNHIELDLFPMDAGTDKGLTFTAPNWPAKPQEKIYKLGPFTPRHGASAFYYPNITSLPPIAKVVLTKISEYKRKGKELPPIKQERNLVIFDERSRELKEVIPQLEKIIDRAVNRGKKARTNEIPTPDRNIDSDPGCAVSEWSSWSACSKSCGFGQQYRRRAILRRATSPSLYCPVLREDRTCGTMRSCQWNSFQFLSRKGGSTLG